MMNGRTPGGEEDARWHPNNIAHCVCRTCPLYCYHCLCRTSTPSRDHCLAACKAAREERLVLLDLLAAVKRAPT